MRIGVLDVRFGVQALDVGTWGFREFRDVRLEGGTVTTREHASYYNYPKSWKEENAKP